MQLDDKISFFIFDFLDFRSEGIENRHNEFHGKVPWNLQQLCVSSRAVNDASIELVKYSPIAKE